MSALRNPAELKNYLAQALDLAPKFERLPDPVEPSKAHQ
jgi:hypothetical protein